MPNPPASFNKAGPVLVFGLVLALVAITVYAVRSSLVLRYELKQAHEELGRLKEEGNQPATGHSTADDAITAKEREIARLQSLLSQQNLSATTETASPTTTGEAGTTPTNRVSWLDRLKSEDPDRYQRIVESREQRRQQIDQYFDNQFARFDERLQTAQSQEEIDLVNNLSETLARAEELRYEWEKLQQLPEEERREKGAELRTTSMETFQRLRELRAQDRTLQLRNYAASLGYSNPQDLNAFVAAIQRIEQETETGMGRFFGGGDGPGRGGRRGQ